MRKFFLISFVIARLCAGATTYYVAASGSDASAGTSASSPWKTIAKVNSFPFSPGDNILFNKGDQFYGKIIIARSGTLSNTITYGVYGTGDDPVITGFTTITDWTNLGSNIWESASAVSTLPYINMVAVNGVNTPMGRYPNTGSYFTYSSPTTSPAYSITSNTALTTNWTGAELVAWNMSYNIIRNKVTSQAGSKVTFTHNSVDQGFQTPNGFFVPNFFFQNDPRTLDTQNEWYYNPSTKKIRIYSTGSPAGVQVSTIDTLVYINGKSYITFDGLSFQGSNTAAIDWFSSNNITIQNCDFESHGKNGIHALYNNGNSNNNKIENCTFNHVNNNTIDVGKSTNAVIRLNSVKNSGVVPGMMSNGGGIAQGVQAMGAGTLIEYNVVDSVGYNGIQFLGSNTILNKNFVNHFSLMFIDGGGIYSYNGYPNTTQSGIVLSNNIVLNGGSNPAIYLDNYVNGVTIVNNTSAFSKSGIYLHDPFTVDVFNNTCYNNYEGGIKISNGERTTTPQNVNIRNNIFFAKLSGDKTGYFKLVSGAFPATFLPDSNYYARPIDDNQSIYTDFYPSTPQYTSRSLSNWQSISGKEIHSRKSPKTVTTANDLRFEYNATDLARTVTLDGNYIDVRNVSYNGSITLGPFSSAILIRNGTATNRAPKANAGPDQIIIL